MKKPMFKIMVLLSCILFGVTACEDDIDSNVATSELPTNDAPEVDGRADLFLVKKIEKNGHEFQFITDGENIDIIERLPVDKANVPGFLEENDDKTPFDIFISLTGGEVAVPKVIANTAKGGALAAIDRQIDYSNTFTALVDNTFGVSSESARTSGCTDVGEDSFYDNYCMPPVVSTPSSIEFCDNRRWTKNVRQSVYDGSWRNVKKVTTRTNVICGRTRIKFLKWDNNRWELYHQVDFRNGVWVWKQYRSQAKRRRVERTQHDGGSFRAFTRFFN
ncbi:MAG: hypothetical protein AAF992_21850 [Bacteroidota bacterium]